MTTRWNRQHKNNWTAYLQKWANTLSTKNTWTLKPTNIKAINRFLSMLNFKRARILGFTWTTLSTILQLLHRSIRSSPMSLCKSWKINSKRWMSSRNLSHFILLNSQRISILMVRTRVWISAFRTPHNKTYIWSWEFRNNAISNHLTDRPWSTFTRPISRRIRRSSHRNSILRSQGCYCRIYRSTCRGGGTSMSISLRQNVDRGYTRKRRRFIMLFGTLGGSGESNYGLTISTTCNGWPEFLFLSGNGR